MNPGKTVIAVLIAAGALSLEACNVGQAKIAAPEDAAAALPVEVAAPQRADIFATYRTTATITADSEAAVPARVAGEVVALLVEEGDRVARGQVLARLDGDRLRLLERQAKANLEKVTREYERFTRLHQQGLVSASAVDNLRFEMDALKASYELQRLDYQYTTIRATIDGVVSARDVKLGQNVKVNDTIFRITDTDRLIADLTIPQTELSRFSVGHEIEVRVDACPDQSFHARVARISPTVDKRNGTFRATTYIDNDRNLLAPGMFGRFAVAYEQHTDALLIPVSALVQEDNETIVYVVEGGAAIRRVIETGIQSGNDVEVLGGLDDDDRIVVTGQGSLRDGSRVFASIDTATPASG